MPITLAAMFQVMLCITVQVPKAPGVQCYCQRTRFGFAVIPHGLLFGIDRQSGLPCGIGYIGVANGGDAVIIIDIHKKCQTTLLEIGYASSGSGTFTCR